jgi:hypothetical protein
MPTLTDAEIKQMMKAVAAVNGMTLSDERIERDLAQYKSLLAAMERIQRVELPLHAEPATAVSLKPASRS